MIQTVCWVTAAGLMAAAGAYLLLGTDKGLGIFLVLVAAILARILVINVPEHLERDGSPSNED